MKIIIPKEVKINKDSLEKNIQQLRQNIKKNILNQDIKKPVGVLFSGGVDSTLISVILKDLNIEHTCYFGYVKTKEEPKDLLSARKVSKYLDINLKEGFVYENELELLLPNIIKTIKIYDNIQVGVAIPLYIALREAKDDGVKTIFCGSGADEVFCGYNVFNFIEKDFHIKSIELLKSLEKKDLLRDNRLADFFSISLVSPFLSKDVISFGLSLKDSYKKTNQRNKIVIRELLREYNLPKEIYEQKKKAAQYGSNSDKSLRRLMKRLGYKKNIEYFKSIIKTPKKRYGCLFSGGKDSNLALFIAKQKGIDVSCLLSILPNSDFSYMFQKPDKNILKLQADALDIPIIFKKSRSIKEKELKDLKVIIKKAIDNYKIEGVITGALFSNYQKKRIEDICKTYNIDCFSPLWQMSQEKELDLLLENHFDFIFCKVAAKGFSKEWLGKTITREDVNKLKEINQRYTINIAGEGGEFETIVLNSPIFEKQIKIVNKKIKMINENCGLLYIKKAKLINK
jgi:diphthine-ammonia ligase